MQFVADLHLHSKYSRAVSQQMILPEMAKWASKKGINLLTTGDWTHPLWMRNIKSDLIEAGEGVYKMRDEKSEMRNSVRFILTTEIASIYKQGEKLRRIHSLIFAPSLEAVEKIREALIKRGANLMSDGRPMMGISAHDLLEIILTVDEKTFLIPCHAWTPHFGIYGSASGFDSLSEAFGDLSKYIYGVETGLSSDPEMNWRIKELENRSILSFSDAHSLPKMGREATVFVPKNGNSKLSYEDIRLAIMKKSKDWRIGYTIEFYPEEGKYHFSGHRNCKVVFGPEEIRTKGNICPACHRRLTEGVLFRVEQLGDASLIRNAQEKLSPSQIKWHVDKTKKHPPYVKLVPLNEIIAESLSSPVGSEKVKIKFDEMCLKFESEMNTLLKTPLSDITAKFGEKIAEGIGKVRKGDIFIDPGYDGEYGKVKIWSEKPTISVSNADQEMQMGLKF